MSGIAGILGRSTDTNVAALTRMSAAMAHRGPDGHGTHVPQPGAGHGCMLAYRHLAVFDRGGSAGAPQPIARSGLAMAFDGSVLNHRDLGAAGHSETVFSHVAARGPQGMKDFRGTFALALWDEAKRQLILARDPLGHRPLYVARNADANGAWSIVFASELRAILASGLLGKPRLNPAAIAEMIWNGFVMSPDTMVRGVTSVLPGQLLAFDASGKQTASEFTWSMPPSEERKLDDEQPMRQALRDAVRLNLASDAPLGVFLSGGIDSGSIANLAQQHSDRPIKTFCMAMEDPSLNEGAAARTIAKAIGSEHHEVMMTEGRFVAALDAAVDSLDQPTFDALNQYHICKAVREAGVTVALGGVGGDAIFGGDSTLRRLPKLRTIAMCSGWVPESIRVASMKLVASVAQKNTGPIGPQQKWAKLPSVTRAGSDLISLYQLTYAMFLPEFQRELIADGARASEVEYGLNPEARRWLERECRDHTPIEIAAILEARCFVGERLLRDADTVSSSLSFELRSPLSDARLIEELNRLPDARKFLPVGYKPLLRRYGLEGLDPKLFDRPKSGFVMPFDKWIRKNLGQVMNTVMRDERLAAAAGLNGEAVNRLWQAFQQGAPGLYWTRVWAVYILIRWCQRHGVVL
jgi:asparagine synthase (glutamine-hydrolysing)